MSNKIDLTNTLIKGRELNFFMVGNDIADSEELTIYEKAVCYQIARYSNGGNVAFPSYNTLAKKTGMSKRKVIDTVKDLVEKNILIKQIRTKEKLSEEDNKISKYHESNLYLLNDNLYKGSACGASGVVHGMHQGSAHGAPYKYININNNTTGVETPICSEDTSSSDEKVKANASKKKKLKPTDIHIEINKHYVSMENALKGCKATNQEFIRNINTLLETYSVEDIKDVISFKNEDAYTNEKSKKYFVPSTIFRLSNFEKTYEYMLQWKNKKNSVGTSNTVQSKKYFVWLGDRLTSQDVEPARGTEYFLSEEEALANKPI